MRKYFRYSIFSLIVIISLTLFYLIIFVILQLEITQLVLDWTFLASLISYILLLEELSRWVRNGKRSELSDLVAIFFFFFILMFFSKDVLTSIMGAFSIYLWLGIYELKDYPVLNKVLIISLITYNIIFISGVISTYLGDPFLLNTTFAFSFWIILILGFVLFGRKYIVIWRFMSPEYLTLFLYIIAWLAVVFIDQYTPLEFIHYGSIAFDDFNLYNFFFNIYFVLILVNWLVYFISGPILDKLLGIKRIKDQKLINLVASVKKNLNIKGRVKVGFGKYPILNAMAYGSIFDKRIALIAEDYRTIPKDEMEGIVAHELAHTKGKHTLILALITSMDLLIRMFLGIPATFYDYTFGNPTIPLLGFLLLNFGIYIFLFIFVRILEARADASAKKAGYSLHLTKALYNLESFYATGREIGLNTMLLCDEKINQDNKIINYIETARYLHNSMIKPSRSSLLANILNSHPPTYHRIAALLDEDLKPIKEAFLPFLLMSSKNVKKYANLFEGANNIYKTIANEKFRELFEISDISAYFHSLRREERYKYDINNTFIFKNKITGKIIIADLKNVEFRNDICSPDVFIIRDHKTSKKCHLDASKYSKKQIIIGGSYFLRNKKVIVLNDILLNEKNDEIKLIFNEKVKKFNKYKTKINLPLSLDTIADFKNQDIFFRQKGNLNIMQCLDITSTRRLEKFRLKFQHPNNGKISEHNLTDLIIKPRQIYLIISKSDLYRKSEYNLINWLKSKRIRTFFSLKKPVNNTEIGYINKLFLLNDKDENYIQIKNIFEKQIEIPYKSIDHLSFQYKTGLILLKKETSFITKLGYKLIKKFKPENIFYLDKV